MPGVMTSKLERTTNKQLNISIGRSIFVSSTDFNVSKSVSTQTIAYNYETTQIIMTSIVSGFPLNRS